MPGSDMLPGTIVRVPFPYSDAETAQHRPGLVVAGARQDGGAPLIWVLMITSAANRGWPGDVEIRSLDGTGLPAPSVIRTAKIATIDVGRAETRGKVPAATMTKVSEALRARLGL